MTCIQTKNRPFSGLMLLLAKVTSRTDSSLCLAGLGHLVKLPQPRTRRLLLDHGQHLARVLASLQWSVRVTRLVVVLPTTLTISKLLFHECWNMRYVSFSISKTGAKTNVIHRLPTTAELAQLLVLPSRTPAYIFTATPSTALVSRSSPFLPWDLMRTSARDSNITVHSVASAMALIGSSCLNTMLLQPRIRGARSTLISCGTCPLTARFDREYPDV